MNAITLNTVVQATPDVLATNMGDETVLLSPQTGMYFGLNSVGQRILELVHEPAPLSAVVAQLASEYDVNQQRLQEDVLAFVADLVQHGIVLVASQD